MLSSNYVGRNIDLCVFDTSDKPGIQDVNIGLYPNGKLISGPYKTVQRFMKALMTSLGSIPSDPTYGSEFSTLLMSGQLHTTLEFTTQFYIAAPSILAYIENNQSDDTPNDERIRSVQLTSVAVISDSLTMNVTFEFDSGSDILVPISIPVG